MCVWDRKIASGFGSHYYDLLYYVCTIPSTSQPKARFISQLEPITRREGLHNYLKKSIYVRNIYSEYFVAKLIAKCR